MPFDVLPAGDALDPYSARVAHAFERVGPAVAHIAAIDRDSGRAASDQGLCSPPTGIC
jgi:hypothetical protein